jgi:hypothetical protein
VLKKQRPAAAGCQLPVVGHDYEGLPEPVVQLEKEVVKPLGRTFVQVPGRKVGAEEVRCSRAEGVIKWDAGAAGVGPGVYIARISAEEFSEAVKFVVTK